MGRRSNKVILIMMLMCVFMLTTQVFGLGLQRKIEVMEDKEIKILLDGNAIDLSNKAPLVYNDTTYLPVRVVAEAVGLPIDWDAEDKEVLLGKTFSKPKYIVDMEFNDFYELPRVTRITDKNVLTANIGGFSTNFKNGLEFNIAEDSESASGAFVRCYGMRTLTGTLYSKDYDCKVTILSTKDGTKDSIRPHTTLEITAGVPTMVEFSIQGLKGYVGFKVEHMPLEHSAASIQFFDVTMD